MGMDAQTVVQAFYAAIEAGDLARMASYLSDHFTFSGPVPQPMGKTAFRAFMDALVAAMPDLKLHTKNFQVQGSKVTLTVQLTATHTAPLHPIRPGMSPMPATGKKVTLPEERVSITVHDDQLASVEVAQVPGGGVPGILAQIGIADAARNA
jgi:predicted ester cyclase